MRILKVALAVLMAGYSGMCMLAKMDGGGSKGMPSVSAEDADNSGMLVKRVTVVLDSGVSLAIGGAWIEYAASTRYRWGAIPYRAALTGLDGDTLHLLVMGVPDNTSFGGQVPRHGGRIRLQEGGRELFAFEIVPPLPDTIFIRPRPPDEFSYPVVFAYGRSLRDAEPR